MYIFCENKLATVWIKICVNCNLTIIELSDLRHKNTTEMSKDPQSYLAEVFSFKKNVLLQKTTFNGLFKRLSNAPTKVQT